MKKIINGVRYDTDKAAVVGSAHAEGYGRNDFGYWEATLYVTPQSRRFFLAGKGGAMTRFAQPIGNNGRIGGAGLHPMTAEDALAWAERYLGLDAIEAHFADQIKEA